MASKAYVVRDAWGYDDMYLQTIIFVTLDKDKAEAYREKYNSMLKKWRDYYYQYCNEGYWGLIQPKDEYMYDDRISIRVEQLGDMHDCWVEEVELR